MPIGYICSCNKTVKNVSYETIIIKKHKTVSIVKQKKKKYSVLTIFLSTFVGENNN